MKGGSGLHVGGSIKIKGPKTYNKDDLEPIFDRLDQLYELLEKQGHKDLSDAARTIASEPGQKTKAQKVLEILRVIKAGLETAKAFKDLVSVVAWVQTII